MGKLGVLDFQFLDFPLLATLSLSLLPIYEAPPNPPHLDSAVLTTTNNK